MESESHKYKRLMCKLLGIELDSNDMALNDYDEEGIRPLYMIGRYFTSVRFDTSLDWVRPVVMECIKLNIWYSEQTNELHDAIMDLDVNRIFNACGKFLETYYNQNSILEKMINDKKAISKCIKEGGDLKQLSEELGIKFATPIK